MKTVKPVKILSRKGNGRLRWIKPKVSKNFAMIREEGASSFLGCIRILNKRTGKLHPGLFKSASDATTAVVALSKWERNNRSIKGRIRTVKGNIKFMAKYHKNKK